METKHLNELREARAKLVELKNLYDDMEPELATAVDAIDEALIRNGYSPY